jgi:hypothetical protein
MQRGILLYVEEVGKKDLELRNSGVWFSQCLQRSNAEVLRTMYISTKSHIVYSQSSRTLLIARTLRFHGPGFNRPRQCVALHATLSCSVKGGSARLDYTGKRREEGLGLVSVQRIAKFKRANHWTKARVLGMTMKLAVSLYRLASRE